MAQSWGPIHQATTDGKTAGHGDGTVTTPHVGSSLHGENYDATDGRHNKADHQGWPSVDHLSGPTSHDDFGSKAGSFEDGPGVWRQT
ncbi:MAG TPA: hypothetical protein VGG75_14325 [Trebonia sp.]|jgi:hypothetical protein